MESNPKYVQVRGVLKDQIQRDYTAGSRIPSTESLRKAFGVSQATINRAIQDLVDEGLLERQRRRGTFVTRGNLNRGLLWPVVTDANVSNPHRDALLRAAERAADQRGEHLVVRGIRRHQKSPTGSAALPLAGAIILFNLDTETIVAFRENRTPIVLLEPFLRVPGVPFVAFDNFAAGFEATSHLVAQGHRRIAHATVGFPLPCSIIGERMLGYREAMKAAGLEQHVHVHATPIGTSRQRPNEDDVVDEKASKRAFLDMLDRVQPTALFCFDDLRAAWVIRVCHDHGIAIPKELSLVGINDDGTAAQVWPSLTTIRIPSEDLGRAAVRVLDTLIDEGRMDGGGELVPGQLVERASVRSLPGGTHADGASGAGSATGDAPEPVG